MNVRIVAGDIFQDPAVALVNPVNCTGVMGAGLALAVKVRHPRVVAAYRVACAYGKVRLGRVHTFDYGPSYTAPRYVISFPTKHHWRSTAVLGDIESGMVSLAEEIIEKMIPSVAVPALGCGLGGLKWDDVRPVIIDGLRHIPDLDLHLYQPL